MKLSQREYRIAGLYTNLNNVFRNEDDTEYYKIEGELDETYFTDLIQAFCLHFKHMTDSEADLIDFIGILNKLVIQHLLDKQSGETE